MMRNNQVLSIWLPVVLLGLSGCGNGMPQVSGRVTLDGEPLGTSGTSLVDVSFSPLDGGAMATARADADGHYKLSTGASQGVVAGKYTVTVMGREYGASNEEGAAPSIRLFTPSRYAIPKQSGLAATVKDGSNQFDFDLKSDSE